MNKEKMIAHAHMLANPPLVIVDNNVVSPKILTANPNIELVTLNEYFVFGNDITTTYIKLRDLEIPNLTARIDPLIYKINKLYIVCKKQVKVEGNEWSESYYIDVTEQLKGEF